MLEDVQSWKNSKVFGDVPHIKTGATALHVAAAKGYIKVIGLLIQAGAPVNAQVEYFFYLHMFHFLYHYFFLVLSCNLLKNHP